MPGPGYSFLDKEEAQLVGEVIADWSLGRYRFGDDAQPSMVWRLERELEDIFGARRCIAMNSGTSALYAALTALGVGPGDEVVVPGYTFVASIAAIVYRGAIPVLSEIDDSLTLDPADIAERITPRTRAVMAVHMLGAPCDLEALQSIVREHGLVLIEDVAQACGARYGGRALGTFGDAGAFSLNAYKTITSGVGGFLLCDDELTYRRAFAVHDHGFVPDGLGCSHGDEFLGLNFRMNELPAAVALAQARKLPTILEEMRARKRKLADAIGEVPGARRRRIDDDSGECGSVLVYIFDKAERARAVAEELNTITLIDSGRHYYGNMTPLVGQLLSSRVGRPRLSEVQTTESAYRAGALPRTDDVLARSLALSVGVVDTYLGTGFGIDVTATDSEIEAVADVFRSAVNAQA